MALLPPMIVPVDGPVVFLAGPIKGAPDWQAEATQWFADSAPGITVASPRRPRLPGEFDYAGQVDWETHFLRRAADNGVILFWLAREVVSIPGRAYAQTTRFELAEWKVRHERDGVRLVVGIEDGFTGERYIRHCFAQDCPRVPLVTTLPEACAAATMLAGLPSGAFLLLPGGEPKTD
ncbi:nucleoside 2-deoxyribosyltransferase domain-containing protein [Zavarzinella formosa]|uniref:nucleoside 2-deoxyribosyltransferase domain-containing protein n=1 Tax=Zavarzinella formosa TaxID=360055 RepID=UPI0003653AEE|nr:nucleoside 2-deoxyribosyltransferase domain-containing protein [Zavarzinella formosa]